MSDTFLIVVAGVVTGFICYVIGFVTAMVLR